MTAAQLELFVTTTLSLFWALLATLGVVLQLLYYLQYYRAYRRMALHGPQERDGARTNYESQLALCGVHVLLWSLSMLFLDASLTTEIDGNVPFKILSRSILIIINVWLIIVCVRNWLRLSRMLVRLEPPTSLL